MTNALPEIPVVTTPEHLAELRKAYGINTDAARTEGHTPQWSVDGANPFLVRTGRDEDETGYVESFEANSWDNAVLIVKAVNRDHLFDEMAHVLGNLIGSYETLEGLAYNKTGAKLHGNIERVAKAKALLSKLEGK